MEHLITLKLRPTPGYASSPSFPPSQSARRSHNRRITAPVNLVLYPKSPSRNFSAPDLKRLSDKSFVPVKHSRSVSSMPKTSPLFQTQANLKPFPRKDWEGAVKDVKRLYFKREYKSCAERCMDILENSRGSIHRLHSLFFSFYAATCLEVQALSLHIRSTARLPLLKLAKAYYEIAASYISSAETTCSTPSPLSRCESLDYSLSYSSSSSISSMSRSSTDSLHLQLSPLPSPASSVYDSTKKHTPKKQDEKLRLRPLPLNLVPKKNVSFDTGPIGFNSSSHIRITAMNGDNFEEHYFPLPPPNCSIHKAISTHDLKFPPGPPPTTPLPILPLKTPNRNKPLPPLPPLDSKQSKIAERHAIIQSQLLSFRPQVSYHLTKLSKIIYDTTTASAESDEILLDLEDGSPGYSVGEREWQHEEDLEYFHRTQDVGGEGGWSADHDENVDTEWYKRRVPHMSMRELRRRIEERRERGWIREKFDGGKYERLCERALMELGY